MFFVFITSVSNISEHDLYNEVALFCWGKPGWAFQIGIYTVFSLCNRCFLGITSRCPCIDGCQCSWPHRHWPNMSALGVGWMSYLIHERKYSLSQCPEMKHVSDHGRSWSNNKILIHVTQHFMSQTSGDKQPPRGPSLLRWWNGLRGLKIACGLLGGWNIWNRFGDPGKGLHELMNGKSENCSGRWKLWESTRRMM